MPRTVHPPEGHLPRATTPRTPYLPGSLDEKAWLTYSISPSDDKAALTIARQVMLGWPAPCKELLVHLQPSSSDMKKVLKGVFLDHQPVLVKMIEHGPGPLSDQARTIEQRCFDHWCIATRFQFPGDNKPVPKLSYDGMLQSYYDSIRDAETIRRWASALTQGVGEDLIGQLQPNESSNSARMMFFAAEDYGFDLVLDVWRKGIENAAQRIASWVVDHGKKPPSRYLVKRSKPNHKDLLAAFAKGLAFIRRTLKTISKDVLKPPDWLQPRLDVLGKEWNREKVSSVFSMEEAIDAGIEIERFTKCMKNAAECSTYRKAQQRGVWAVTPKGYKPRSPEPWEDDVTTDDECFFGPDEE